MSQRDLFISHSSSDAGTANDLVTDFERHGISCWIAPRDIPLGSGYHREIVNAIAQCRAMLLLFSVTANESDHVLREVELAAQGRKPIYPLRLDGVEPAGGLKYMLANMQWVERRALGDRLTATIEQLLRASGPAEQAAPVLSSQPAPTERGPRIPSAIWAAAVAAAVVLLGAAWYLMRPPEPAPHPSATVTRPREVTPASLPSATAAKLTQTNTDKITVASRVPSELTSGGSRFFRECNECPVMAVVPAGRTLIGSPNDEPGHTSEEGPQREVAFTQPFAIGRSEVTFEQWFACVAEGGCRAYRPGDYGWGAGSRPVINVSWIDATAYVEWLSRKTGASYRLPSEAEWEYAARGCKSACPSTAFWFGNTISPEQANYDWRYSYEGSPKMQALRQTIAADSGAANPFGLLHTQDNVREWVQDCWNPTLAGLPSDGSARTTGDCSRRVVRGGSWFDEPQDLRTAKRNWAPQEERRAQIGFRVTRSLGRGP
jgi:formylglycine-generating enzyme required for sulfatase activity